MRLRSKPVALLAIAAAAVAGGAWWFAVKQEERVGEAVAKPKSRTARQPPAPAALSALPLSHPPLAAPPPPAPVLPRDPLFRHQLPPSHPPVAAAPAGASARQGRVQVDAARPYTHYRVGNHSVVAIYEEQGVMWLGTSGGIVRYDTATHEFRTYDTHDGLRASGILYLGKLRGRIAAGTYGGGLSLLDPATQQWEHYGSAEGLGDAFVYDVLEASNGDVWIATGSGVNQVRGGDLKDRARWVLHTVASTAGGLPHNRVYRLAEGRDGIWIATRGGLARFRNSEWENWARWARSAGSGTASDSDHIAALEVDRDGIVWAGTRGAGLVRFDGVSWKNYTVAQGLPSNQISTLGFDPKGRLWIGTRSGLAIFNDGKFRIMTTAHGLLTENVLSLAATRDGDVWVGGFGGVARLRQPALN